MEFLVALLRRLHDDREVDLPSAAQQAYAATLQPYHGWISSSAFSLAMRVRVEGLDPVLEDHYSIRDNPKMKHPKCMWHPGWVPSWARQGLGATVADCQTVMHVEVLA